MTVYAITGIIELSNEVIVYLMTKQGYIFPVELWSPKMFNIMHL